MTIENDPVAFYDTHYDLLGSWLLRPGENVILGNMRNRICRFCHKAPPEVTFRKLAHAIPEALGNKSIETAYECDTCNDLFGRGIENDLGNWSKPMRTFARIRGKSGVPTLKKDGAGPGWRIEYSDAGLKISSYEDNPVYQIDESSKTITFNLKRDAYTPVAVLKAFMKVGLTLLPDDEVQNFPHLLAWVRQTDHGIRFAEKSPVLYTFQPGPMPNDLIAAFILRRKSDVTNYPYAFLVLAYGNEAFQVQLPSQKNDASLNGQPISIPPFPHPGSPDPTRYGPPRRHLRDFTGRDLVRGEVVRIVVGYDQATDMSADTTEA